MLAIIIIISGSGIITPLQLITEIYMYIKKRVTQFHGVYTMYTHIYVYTYTWCIYIYTMIYMVTS